MLTLQHLTRQLQGHPVDMTLLPGCLLHLKGNSAIISRLFRLISGRIKCPKGRILFAEQESRGDKEFAADCFYLPAYHGPSFLQKRRTIKQQLEKWVKRGGFPELLSTAIHYFQLEAVLHQKIHTLSPDLWQRMRLSQLILQPCTIWLLENPLSRLNDEGRERAEVLIAGRCKQNGIVLMLETTETRLNPHYTFEL